MRPGEPWKGGGETTVIDGGLSLHTNEIMIGYVPAEGLHGRNPQPRFLRESIVLEDLDVEGPGRGVALLSWEFAATVAPATPSP